MNLETQLFSLLKKYRQDKLTGKIILSNSNSSEWQIYLFMGQIVWANGGLHSHRSWLRHLIVYLPKIETDKIKFRDSENFECYQYHTLRLILQRNLARLEQIKAITENRLKEVFFDLLQQESQMELVEEIQEITPHDFLNSGFKTSTILLNTEDILLQSQQTYAYWQQKVGLNVSLEKAPIIVDREKLQNNLKPAIYQKFIRLFDGQNTLRDLAYKLHKNPVDLTSSLIPYIARKWLKFATIPDLPRSFTVQCYKMRSQNSQLPSNQFLIGCVDDSVAVCRTMEQILTQAGYKFIGVQNPLQAIPKMIAAKPDFIFVDIGMPMMNGYEVCAQLKKVSLLKDVPVVMLTGRDGFHDRIRARFSGASDFITKPIVEQTILETIDKFTAAPKCTEPVGVS